MQNFFVNHYFFTITPSSPVQAFISDLKKQVREAIGHEFQSEFSPVHIPLFQYSQHHADSILDDADLLRATLLPLDIYVNGLGVFKHGNNKTIYLQIEYKIPVADLAKALGGKSITPHIIIARNLTSEDFDKAWKCLQENSYNNHFRCTNVTVLKRDHHRWNKYLELPLSQDSVLHASSLYREPVCL
jgi:2'-5' RNA ligase